MTIGFPLNIFAICPFLFCGNFENKENDFVNLTYSTKIILKFIFLFVKLNIIFYALTLIDIHFLDIYRSIFCFSHLRNKNYDHYKI